MIHQEARAAGEADVELGNDEIGVLAAIMMSQASISAKPAPNAPPLTAQITGLVQSEIA